MLPEVDAFQKSHLVQKYRSTCTYVAILICVIMALHQIGSLHIGMVSIVTDIMGLLQFYIPTVWIG